MQGWWETAVWHREPNLVLSNNLHEWESCAPENWCFWTVALEKTPVSPLDCKEIQPVHPKDQSWIFIGRTDAEAETPNTLATWSKELTHWKRPWCWEGLRAGEKGDDRGWDGWMASPTQWTRVWASSGSWWWTGKPGVLQSKGSQRVRHNWATEQNWTEMNAIGEGMREGYMFNYDWFTLLYHRNQDNIIKQLYSNLKINFKK